MARAKDLSLTQALFETTANKTLFAWLIYLSPKKKKYSHQLSNYLGGNLSEAFIWNIINK